MKKFWQVFESIVGVYRWHPKIALRYLPVVEELKKHAWDEDTLEVGSGGIGIAPYLKRRVVGVDTQFSAPIFEKLIPIKAQAQALPFADRSFAAVISLDMLEHIPPQDRLQVIKEMLRVSKKFVCLGAPMGRAANKQDKQLKLEYQNKFGKDFPFLSEQLTYGLPNERQVKAYIYQSCQALGKRVDVKVVGNINLKFRLFLMRGWMTRNFIINILFRKIFLIFIPLFLTFNQSPTYRKIFFVKIHD